MPRYYFDLANDHRLADPSGLVRRDDEDAKAKTEVIARQIAAEAPALTGRRVNILDLGGQEIAAVPIDEK